MGKGEWALKWPYEVKYGSEKEVSADVVILGGGPAGCMAAIAAAKAGVNVILVDKAHAKRSGGGSGVDHWLTTPTPASSITPEACVDWESDSYGGYINALSRYIAAREGWDTLLELEEMGAKIRDTDDQFKGAPFRDEITKLLFAYDYQNRVTLRIWGTTFKSAMYNKCKSLGVEILNRMMVTSLLTENGLMGGRVMGATAFNSRTGEFVILKGKAVINCMAFHEANWLFSTELTGLPYFHPNVVCDGPAIAWKAGAEFTMMEKSAPSHPAGFHFPSYGSGNPKNTWYPASMVDATGKEIPWVDGMGNPIAEVSERTCPAEDQDYFGDRSMNPRYKLAHLVDDLEERVRKGEFMLPLYADLTGMPEYERKAIWGLMVGEEGRTKVPVKETYEAAGFDPDKDLLQNYFLLGGEPFPGMWQHAVLPFVRGRGPFASPGGMVADWNLQSNVEGLFVAGNALFAGNYYHHAAVTGRYAGRKAAAFAKEAPPPSVFQDQIEQEKHRVYEPIKRSKGIDWKELRAGLCRIMQNYCGDIKNDELLSLGLIWFKDIQENVFPDACAANPHILMRMIESFHILDCNELIIQSSLARKASSRYLGFNRQDHTEVDPPQWHKFITIRQDETGIKTGERPIDFALPLADNYEQHNPDYRGFLKQR
ncbi:MAG: FAD-dependent oxidoreductase [Deltaproteobacteria bacterium]|nr:FAD-dependent oxidoreductase [Deltaproteobacteria bacterium]